MIFIVVYSTKPVKIDKNYMEKFGKFIKKFLPDNKSIHFYNYICKMIDDNMRYHGAYFTNFVSYLINDLHSLWPQLRPNYTTEIHMCIVRLRFWSNFNNNVTEFYRSTIYP